MERCDKKPLSGEAAMAAINAIPEWQKAFKDASTQHTTPVPIFFLQAQVNKNAEEVGKRIDGTALPIKPVNAPPAITGEDVVAVINTNPEWKKAFKDASTRDTTPMPIFFLKEQVNKEVEHLKQKLGEAPLAPCIPSEVATPKQPEGSQKPIRSNGVGKS